MLGFKYVGVLLSYDPFSRKHGVLSTQSSRCTELGQRLPLMASLRQEGPGHGIGAAAKAPLSSRAGSVGTAVLF